MKELIRNFVLAIIFVDFFTGIQSELKLINVVFRHGDRAPDNNGLESYPNDPYKKNTYEPMGLGGLLNKGKLREYELGQYLRKTYGEFLGDIYTTEEVGTRSTDYDRTKMSLQLVLAGLYPPSDVQKWNNHLDWQPIPVHSISFLDDTLMVPESCPKYLKARELVEASQEFQKKTAHFSKFMNDLSVLSGKSINNSNDMYFLYHGLTAEKAFGLRLPIWAEYVMESGQLLDGANLEYDIFSYNVKMRRLNGGMLLRKFIENIMEKISKFPSDEHKIYLYSGHETNVAALLQALDVYKPHVPEYSSAVILELHEENSKYYVKVKYYKGKVQEGQDMVEAKTVPGCTDKCPLYKFRSILKDVIPTNDDIQCDKRSLRQGLLRNEYKVASNIITMINQEFAKYDKSSNTLH